MFLSREIYMLMLYQNFNIWGLVQESKLLTDWLYSATITQRSSFTLFILKLLTLMIWSPIIQLNIKYLILKVYANPSLDVGMKIHAHCLNDTWMTLDSGMKMHAYCLNNDWMTLNAGMKIHAYCLNDTRCRDENSCILLEWN